LSRHSQATAEALAKEEALAAAAAFFCGQFILGCGLFAGKIAQALKF
jgi:hypothetical protein